MIFTLYLRVGSMWLGMGNGCLHNLHITIYYEQFQVHITIYYEQFQVSGVTVNASLCHPAAIYAKG